MNKYTWVTIHSAPLLASNERYASMQQQERGESIVPHLCDEEMRDAARVAIVLDQGVRTVPIQRTCDETRAQLRERLARLE